MDFIEDCTKIQGEDIEMKKSCQDSPFIHFLLEIAINDDKFLKREAIEGENRINEGNHDDHDMINGDDGQNQDHEEVNGDIEDYEEPNQVRRSKRVRQPSQRLLDSIDSIYDNDPLTLKNALNKDDNENWKEAVKLEFKSQMDKKTLRLV